MFGIKKEKVNRIKCCNCKRIMFKVLPIQERKNLKCNKKFICKKNSNTSNSFWIYYVTGVLSHCCQNQDHG